MRKAKFVFIYYVTIFMLQLFKGLAISNSRFMSTMASAGGKVAAETLSKIRLSPIVNGAIQGDAFNAGDIWSDSPAIIYVVRRPG